MKHPMLILALTAFGGGLGGCASQSTARHVAVLGGPSVRPIELPGAPPPGPPREVRVLVDEPALKLVSIALRGGTALPTHHASVPVTIMALSGRGAVVCGAERHPLDATHAVALAADVPHAVEPEAGSDLVVLVHQLGRGEEHHQ